MLDTTALAYCALRKAHDVLYFAMIKSFRDKKTREFADGGFVKSFQGFKQQAEKRLEILDAAQSITDLAALRSNGLEKLGGDRKGRYSIRINEQFRICFDRPDEQDGPINVEITDYH